MPSGKREEKFFPLHILKMDTALGIVDAIVSVLGIVDLGDDVIANGAYVKTLSERGRKVRVLDHHNSFSVGDVVGKPLELREIGRDELPADILEKHPEATGGLWTRTQYAMETEKGRTAFNLIAGGFIDEFSVGFECIVEESRKVGERWIRVIKEVKLWEYSPVIWGMNQATAIVGVKADGVHNLIRMVVGEEKAGRMLSAANAVRIRAAFEELYGVLMSAGLMDDVSSTNEEMDKSADEGELGTLEQQSDEGKTAEPSADTAKSLTEARERLMRRIQLGMVEGVK